jgi:hypothetical protein
MGTVCKTALTIANKPQRVLGAVLGVVAYLLFYNSVQSFATLLPDSIIEISFGIFMFLFFRRDNKIV